MYYPTVSAPLEKLLPTHGTPPYSFMAGTGESYVDGEARELREEEREEEEGGKESEVRGRREREGKGYIGRKGGCFGRIQEQGGKRGANERRGVVGEGKVHKRAVYDEGGEKEQGKKQEKIKCGGSQFIRL